MSEPKTALITGGSSGIGLELARCAAEDGSTVILCADGAEKLEAAAAELRAGGATVQTVIADLTTEQGLDTLWSAVADRPLDHVMANAGRGLGHSFVEQDWRDIADVIALNVTGTTALLYRVLRKMQARGQGRVLVTGSIAGFIPGSYHAIYNASKAYVDSLCSALRDETRDSGVTVTCLMPGLTESDFFADAGLGDTRIAEADKGDPRDVARKGYEAMKAGRAGITPGVMNKIQTAFAGLIPDSVLAAMHRRLAEPR
ncbi:MAG: SDR family NAD(P)-dependent oxidoreductase [Tranquillimonas sp.]